MKKSVSLAFGLLASAAIVGCQSGNVTDRTQNRDVSEDGRVATQTRTQTRQTPSGSTVRETETQRREVVNPGPATRPNAAARDPGKM